jgi:hypothetical protein
MTDSAWRERARRLAPVILALALVAIWLVFGSKIPRDQTVHVVLGDAAPRVTEVRLTYSDTDATPRAGSDDFSRDATYRYAEGSAPRVVTHEARLRNGDYVLEIELSTRKGASTAQRRVKLHGDPVSVDVREAVP